MSTSIRNRIPGTIKTIVSDNVVSELTLRTAAGDVTAIITTGSVKRMNLKVGDNVFAIIKATEVSLKSNKPLHAYQIRPRKDHRGVDLISDALPFGPLWYAEPNAISNAVDYAKFRSRSHDALIRVYDDVAT
jgi:molybdopterin-binding protein